jgi:hypothetical protein
VLHQAKAVHEVNASPHGHEQHNYFYRFLKRLQDKMKRETTTTTTTNPFTSKGNGLSRVMEEETSYDDVGDIGCCSKEKHSKLRRGLAEASAEAADAASVPTQISLRGGVRGGHSAAVMTNNATSSATMFPSPLGLSANDYGPGGRPSSHTMDETWWPKGFANVGNTCYANAALQCLLSTALTNALLDPKTVPILRRYSSNPNLLAMGSGSVDSSEDCEDDCEDDQFMDEEEDGILKVVDTTSGTPSGLTASTPTHTNKKKKRKNKTHDPCEDEAKRKERERRKMEDNCKWLTQELTSITQEYMEEPRPSARSSFASSFGSGGRSSMIGWFGSDQQNNSAAQDQQHSVVNPGSITRHPDRLSKCLSPYQQEDAHEFMRALLSTLVMNGHNKQLSSLFDGLLESSVTCQTCGRASLTRDRYMDLSLDINDVDISTLDDALYEFTKTERLTDDNAVFCQKCRKKRTVNKGLRLATAPSILVCHLKRFAFNDYGRLVRLHKRIEFPRRLEIGDYMSNLNKARPPPYDLVGILVHQGQTCASGHYLAFVKKNGDWFKCNDSEVTRVDEQTVMMQQAYILMYEVAEMRENAAFQPRPLKKEVSLMSTIESSDDATMSKESFSAHASHWSSDRSTSKRSFHQAASFQGQGPNESTAESFIRILRDSGVTQFISDLCCESTTRGMLHEPETHAMERYHHHRSGKNSITSNNNSGRSERRRYKDRHAHECESVDTQDSIIRRHALLSSGNIQVLEVERKTTGSHRAQTAPRQRLHSDDYREPSFDAVSPYTTFTPRASAGGKHRKFPSQGTFSKKTDSAGSPATTSKSRRDRNRSDRPRYSMSERGREDLPPLMPNPAKHRRDASNSMPRKTSSHNVD